MSAKIWYAYPMTQDFLWTRNNRYAHSGIDLGVHYDTAVVCPFPGTVTYADCRPWGGQVDVLINYAGSAHILTVLHLHKISVSQGQSLPAGALLGYSGGDSNGPCPTQSKYSNGPHVHLELTAGALGPYHGASPYNITETNYPVNPSLLLAQMRASGGINAGTPPNDTSYYAGVANPGALPLYSTVFAIPQAIVETTDNIPGIANLIYRLHDAETFPGWKSIDEVAGPASNPLDAANPGRVLYWFVGNSLGNARAMTVHFIYASIGMILLGGLVIALAAANADKQIEVASDATKVIAPFV